MLQRKISHDKRKISHAATKTGYSQTNQYLKKDKLWSALDSYWASQEALMVKNPPAMQEAGVQSLGWEDPPGGGHGNPFQYFCQENPHGQRSLAGYTPHGVAKSRTGLKQLSTHTPVLHPFHNL